MPICPEWAAPPTSPSRSGLSSFAPADDGNSGRIGPGWSPVFTRERRARLRLLHANDSISFSQKTRFRVVPAPGPGNPISIG